MLWTYYVSGACDTSVRKAGRVPTPRDQTDCRGRGGESQQRSKWDTFRGWGTCEDVKQVTRWRVFDWVLEVRSLGKASLRGDL